MALLRTHYYGGIKKYQWVTIPLSLHGLIVKGDGSFLNVTIGEEETDPVFVINDSSPSLGRVRTRRRSPAEGEKLTALAAASPTPRPRNASSCASWSFSIKSTAWWRKIS
jgi:aspartyl aminopeptidase